MQFIKFTERNQHEGETWRFYLQVDGNEDQITKLRRLLAGYNVKPSISYELDDQLLEETTVDALVEHGDDEGYMPAHNKVVGRFVCPDDLGHRADELYKGSIEEFFTAVEVSDV
jgi:hypothetical protein